ncbi:unnamed protein product, partial [Porites evermanni]
MDEEITCAICQKSLHNVNDVVTLREKGSEGINRASAESNVLIQTVPGQRTEQSFNFKTDCFSCGTNVFRVTTLETKHTVLQTCFERKDEWAEVVRARILHVHDLPAADVI